MHCLYYTGISDYLFFLILHSVLDHECTVGGYLTLQPIKSFLGPGYSVPYSFQELVCPGVTQYQITFQTGTILETENVSIAECTAGRCRHIFEPSPDPLNCCIPSSYDNVSVAAENVAGVGAAGTCSAQPISEFK